MRASVSCIDQRLVDAHFGRGLDREAEARLRAHLPGCTACRSRYNSLALLARLDPTSVSTLERIGRPLGLAGRRGAHRRSALPFAAGALAVAAAVTIAAGRWREPEDGSFRARGGPPHAETDGATFPHLRVFRVEQGKSDGPKPAARSLRRTDDLAFAYESPGQRPYLMIFAVDEARRVYWYYPAWTDTAQDPVSLRIEPGGLRTLPEAVSHDLSGRSLSVYAIFSKAPLHVSDVERSAAAGAPLGTAFAAAGAVVESESFEVGP